MCKRCSVNDGSSNVCQSFITVTIKACCCRRATLWRSVLLYQMLWMNERPTDSSQIPFISSHKFSEVFLNDVKPFTPQILLNLGRAVENRGGLKLPVGTSSCRWGLQDRLSKLRRTHGRGKPKEFEARSNYLAPLEWKRPAVKQERSVIYVASGQYRAGGMG